ncbi:MAG: tRNA (adenosine(37)-N6)-threonylcarbamoyltransferase complex ATPase subunit type 1 TsaE [Proteobacteria bacterium]|nr:tRNA (adenosine(37)-N6)-threonylcarbamoyltransferase complex ATPase subunit type 1 TsaE [Pseudomonadota bacterium]NCA28585.1 tRNA (adenosine(37)-N6)-threonylcarbamoyltransferase complex ATPase subunit type 1 TsaE [Pseudomonadota bacterium]
MSKILINSQLEMIRFAQQIATQIQPKQTVALFGNLGVGKSFFTKNFINFLQEIPNEVLSPTFNLVYSYKTKKGEIFHFDLYRIKNSQDLENIGFFDIIQNHITLIEWPQIAEKYLPKNCIKITIKNVINLGEEAREIIIENNE